MAAISTLVVVLLFLGAMVLLAWLALRRQRHGGGPASVAVARVLSAVAVGPQQRVVTLEVGPAHARTWLVLGVTARQVNCLHVLPALPQACAAQVAPAVPAFSREIRDAFGEPGKSAHG